MPLDAAILVTPDQGMLQVHVTSDTPAPLAWRLTVRTGSGGGNSIVQSGVTRGENSEPLGTVRLGGTVSGVARLVVSEGDKVISDTEIPFAFGPARR